MSSARPPASVPTVGIIANPWAGKDVRRLHARSGHGADSSKIGIVQRAIVGAIAGGAERILVASDVGSIGRRAVAEPNVRGAAESSGADIELVEGPATGSALDSRRAAAEMTAEGASPIIVLGGDGTSRDVALGSPAATIIPLSTGTNNVFPRLHEATSAGWAAGLVAADPVEFSPSIRRAKRVVATLRSDDAARAGTRVVALVDLALVDTARIGARAVLDATSVRAVVAAIAEPATTGLSAIAGRVHPVDRTAPGGVAVTLGSGGRLVLVPLVPGAVRELAVVDVRPLGPGDQVVLEGPGSLACDGERDLVLHTGESAAVHIDQLGPFVVDVDDVLARAAATQHFDRPDPTTSSPTNAEPLSHGN